MLGPTSDKYKGYKEVNCVVGEDRISKLPSCLIGHILSLLPAKDAVATSVLSKHWENLWTLITSLEFNDRRLLKHGNRNNSDTKIRFTNFVYRVLLQCRSLNISKFHLECCEKYDASHVIAWVSMVLRFNVHILDISVLVEPYSAKLPRNLFNSETLVKMELSGMFVVSLPSTSVCHLPCLKTLCLNKVKLLDEDSISRVIGCCPVLEELGMTECIGEQVKAVNISSAALRSLDIKWLWCDGDIKIVLKTPKLSYLAINDFVAQDYELKDLHYLSQAKVDLYLKEDFDEVHKEDLHGLLEGISEVKFLTFGSDLTEAIVRCKCQLPVFQNVSELTIGCSTLDGTRELLPVLLKNMPCLTNLTFDQGFGDEDENERKWLPHEDVPNCLSLCLKKIEIMDFIGTKDEREIVKYFLKNGKVLEKMIIHTNLSNTARASSICKVEIL